MHSLFVADDNDYANARSDKGDAADGVTLIFKGTLAFDLD
jgi:hypothetical protein